MMTTIDTLEVRTVDGDSRAIARETWEIFEREIEGSIAFPGDPAYGETTTIWNGMITKRPAVVIRPSSVQDVARAVAFVRDNGLALAIKGGGHNIAGLALSDGGVTLDMCHMNTVDVDAAKRTVTVGPGCTLGDVDRATQEHGLATTLGFVSETGVAGLTLGGGFGYLTRQFGWTVDDLREIEIVTADGEVRRASRGEHEDLFWAVRGGGGNFGVATRFTFALHDIGPDVTAGLIAWSADEAEGVLRLFKDATARAPRQLTMAALMRNAPPAPWLPADKHGRPMVALVINHTGTEHEAETDLAAIRSFGRPWADLIQRKAYVAQQAMLDATQPKGMHYYWKSEFLPGLSDELLDVYRAQFAGMQAPANQIVLFHLDGALREHDEDDGAVGNRDAAFACVVQSMSRPDSPATAVAANHEWTRAAWQALRRFSTGGNYVNFQTADESPQRVSESYRTNLGRLAAIKATYDPDNLFRVNRNITPAG
jgi:FAD/FMN-containing dehydrogenase